MAKSVQAVDTDAKMTAISNPQFNWFAEKGSDMFSPNNIYIILNHTHFSLSQHVLKRYTIQYTYSHIVTSSEYMALVFLFASVANTISTVKTKIFHT